MAKLSDKSCGGTSFMGVVINTTVEKLTKAIGHAQCIQNDGKDKTNFDWTCETENGDVFTIYDWKEYRKISETETIEFHIGAFSESVAKTAVSELKEALNKI